MTHVFSIGETVVAEGTSKGVVKGKNGVVAPEEVFAAIRARPIRARQ